MSYPAEIMTASVKAVLCYVANMWLSWTLFKELLDCYFNASVDGQVSWNWQLS